VIEQAAALNLDSKWMEKIAHAFKALPALPNSGKIIVIFEVHCGPGGTVNEIECSTNIKRKWR